MIVLRFASLVAALVTITLNAAYGFKTSTVLEYAILFAVLSAALDVAKCACLVGASRAWQTGQTLPAVLLFLLFWPLLLNSLWCGMSEVTFNRATETARHDTAAQIHQLAKDAHARAANQLADLEASPPFKSSTACALPRTARERTLCQKHAEASRRATLAADALTRPNATDPAPQLTLLAAWLGYDHGVLHLAASLWTVALAELCGSLGFYLSARRDHTERLHNRFWQRAAKTDAPIPKTVPAPVQRSPVPGKLHWPAIST